MPKKTQTTAIAAEDSDKKVNYFRDKTERMEDAIRGLQALEILFAGHQDKAISDLANLTAPFLENMEKINNELMEFFYQSGVVFAFPEKIDQSNNSEQETVNV